jgi:hypothetical protein
VPCIHSRLYLLLLLPLLHRTRFRCLRLLPQQTFPPHLPLCILWLISPHLLFVRLKHPSSGPSPGRASNACCTSSRTRSSPPRGARAMSNGRSASGATGTWRASALSLMPGYSRSWCPAARPSLPPLGMVLGPRSAGSRGTCGVRLESEAWTAGARLWLWSLQRLRVVEAVEQSGYSDYNL